MITPSYNDDLPRVLTLEQVTAALAGLSVQGLQCADAFSYPNEIEWADVDQHRVWRVINLRRGVTGADLLPHRNALAAALRRAPHEVMIYPPAYEPAEIYLYVWTDHPLTTVYSCSPDGHPATTNPLANGA